MAHALRARAEASYLPPATKAKEKAVHECGDGPSRVVDWLCGRNGLAPGHQVRWRPWARQARESVLIHRELIDRAPIGRAASGATPTAGGSRVPPGPAQVLRCVLAEDRLSRPFSEHGPMLHQPTGSPLSYPITPGGFRRPQSAERPILGSGLRDPLPLERPADATDTSRNSPGDWAPP